MSNTTIPLRHGLTAVYITNAELAAQERAEARRKKDQADDQLHFDDGAEP